MTVSRVINDTEGVTAPTRARVEAAMQQLSYRPNIFARGLVKGRSGTIGVVTFDTAQYGPNAALLGIERAARRRGYGVSIAALPRLDRDSLTEAVDSLADRSIDGVIVIAAHVSAASALAEVGRTLPLVSVEAGQPGAAPMVAVDQRLGARLATDHLLELGHPTVWHIAGPEEWYESAERIEGWREALSAAGVPAPPVVRGDWSAASGYRAAHDLMGRTSKASAASAVFAANDQMALGFMHALFERRMTAPHPISLVGYDDFPESAYFSPALTAVRQDFDEMGRRAVELLAEAIDGRSVARDHLELIEPQLVLRSSTAEPEASDRWTR
jgi:DNA-binding LacI/PurR family transcriptional regulator